MSKQPDVIAERKMLLGLLGFNVEKLKPYQFVPSETTLGVLQILERCGFTHDETRRMSRRNFGLLYRSPEDVKNVIGFLLMYGFGPGQIHRIGKRQPRILTSSLKRLRTVTKNLEDKGFDSTEIVQLASHEPKVLYLSAARSNVIIDELTSRLGSNAAARHAIMNANWLLQRPVREIRARFEKFTSWGLSQSRAVKLVHGKPGILTDDLGRLDETFDILTSIDIAPETRANAFRFSPALLRGRITHMRSVGAKVPGVMFLANSYFQKRFSITRDQAIALDPGPEAFKTVR